MTRTLLATTAVLAAVAFAGPTFAAGFEFKDARGDRMLTLEQRPATVVAQSSVAAALWDAGYHVAGVYGEVQPDADGKLSYQAGTLDPAAVKVLGHTYGEFNIEDYGLMSPQLIIDYTFDGQNLWYVPAEQSAQILALAPSLAVAGSYRNTDEAIANFVDLAGRLGADTQSAELAADKGAYEAALAAIRDAASTSGLKVVVMSPAADSLYVANPPYLPELQTMRDAGLDIMDPVKADATVFTQYSWEQASDYSAADVILVDARTFGDDATALANVPTWQSLPAVKAGQVYRWYAAAPYSYKAYAKIYQEIADELKAAKKLGG